MFQMTITRSQRFSLQHIFSTFWGISQVLLPQNETSQRLALAGGVEGGEAGIRTLGRVTPSPVFKTGAIGRSATSPARDCYCALYGLAG